MSTGWRVVLVVSLALNLIVAGVIGGAALRYASGGSEDRRARIDGALPPHVRALPLRDRREVGREIRDRYRSGAQPRETERVSYAALISALGAEPFDADRVREVVAGQRDNAMRRFQIAQDVWLAHIEKMSDAERADYAERLQEELSRKRPGQRKPPKN